MKNSDADSAKKSQVAKKSTIGNTMSKILFDIDDDEVLTVKGNRNAKHSRIDDHSSEQGERTEGQI